MKVFVDANVILDVLDQREQFFEASSNVLSLGAEHKIILFTTAMTMATCIYILRKPLGYQGSHKLHQQPKRIHKHFPTYAIRI